MQLQYPNFRQIAEMQESSDIQVMRKEALSKRRYVLIPILAGAIVLLVLLALFAWLDYRNSHATESKEYTTFREESVNITEAEMDEYFKEAYGWSDMESHQVLWSEKDSQVLFEVTFGEGARDWQIHSAQEYGKDTFVHGIQSSLAPQIYQVWAAENAPKHVIVETRNKEHNLMTRTYYEVHRDVEEKLANVLPLYSPSTYEILFEWNKEKPLLTVRIIGLYELDEATIQSVKSELIDLCDKYWEVELVLEKMDASGSVYYSTIIEKQ